MTPPAQQNKGEIVSLSAMRGIAAWWVVIYHASDLNYYQSFGAVFQEWLSKGYLAVDFFFILSGFIIAKSYGTQLQKFTFRGYAKFLWLRFARIYPLHFVMLILYLSVPLAIVTMSSQGSISGRFTAEYYACSFLLIQNWGFLPTLDWNVPAWSISTEWLAYILFPLLLAVTDAVDRLRLTGVLVFALLLAVAVVFALAGGLTWYIERCGAIRCVLEFWAGVCLFRLVPADSSRLSRTLGGFAFAALCAVHAGLGAPDYLVMPTAFLCLVFALSRDDGVFSAVLANPVLYWLGTISYSTYLLHFFVREWVKLTMVRDGIQPSLAFLAYVAATLVGSVVLYKWVEVPGRTALRGLIAAGASGGDAAPPRTTGGRAEPARSGRDRRAGEPGPARADAGSARVRSPDGLLSPSGTGQGAVAFGPPLRPAARSVPEPGGRTGDTGP